MREDKQPETIYRVHWGPRTKWTNSIPEKKDNHHLYQLYGRHYVFGPNALLYIGMSEQNVESRIKAHFGWGQYEPDELYFHMGGISVLDGRTGDIDDTAIRSVESLLIYAHAPPYNSHQITGSHPGGQRDGQTDTRV